MEILLQSVKDIIKYKVIDFINTGDKTFDNLLITLSISIITIIFAFNFREFLEKCTCLCTCLNRTTKITSQNREFLVGKIAKMPQVYANITENCDTIEFVQKLSKYFLDIYPESQLSTINVVDNVAKISNASTSLFPEIKLDFTYPLYMKGDKHICLCMRSCSTGRYPQIIGDSIKTIEQFLKTIDQVETNDITDITELKCTTPWIYIEENYSKPYQYKLYIDRSFDSIVTKYKKMILNTLDDFKLSLSGKSKFNGFGSYNLGVILHGVPGTGKTSLIKAIALYLNRDVRIINMRKIKTVHEFKRAIAYDGKYETCIAVFEEFDCVEGIISRNMDTKNAMELKENKETTKKKELKDEYIRLLQVYSNDKTNPDIKKALDDHKKSIDNLDETLTLDTMLTIIDGMIEQRGRVIIATTNYIDRIDPALLREGRFDLNIKLEEFTDAEAKELLTKMYTGIASKEEFSYMMKKKVREGEFTPVKIINLCHKHQSLRKVIDVISH
jgi:SpoVK/Ycf46/Vps4 family AAA+-type ATPase